MKIHCAQTLVCVVRVETQKRKKCVNVNAWARECEKIEKKMEGITKKNALWQSGMHLWTEMKIARLCNFLMAFRAYEIFIKANTDDDDDSEWRPHSSPKYTGGQPALSQIYSPPMAATTAQTAGGHKIQHKQIRIAKFRLNSWKVTTANAIRNQWHNVWISQISNEQIPQSLTVFSFFLLLLFSFLHFSPYR